MKNPITGHQLTVNPQYRSAGCRTRLKPQKDRHIGEIKVKVGIIIFTATHFQIRPAKRVLKAASETDPAIKVLANLYACADGSIRRQPEVTGIKTILPRHQKKRGEEIRIAL